MILIYATHIDTIINATTQLYGLAHSTFRVFFFWYIEKHIRAQNQTSKIFIFALRFSQSVVIRTNQRYGRE